MCFIVVVIGVMYFSNRRQDYYIKGEKNFYKNCNFYLTSIEKSANLRKKNIKNLYDIIKKNFAKNIIRRGVDGEYISTDEILELKKRKFLKKDNFKINSKSGKYLTNGEIGCFFSHLQVWESIIDNNIEYGIIFEDDAKIGHDFKTKLDILIENLPENFLYISLYNFPAKNQQNIIDELEDYNNFFNKLNNSEIWGTTCYLISLKGAKILTQKLLPIRKAVDEAIADFCSKNPDCYITKTSVVDLSDKFSTANGYIRS